MHRISSFFRFSPVRLLAFLLLVLPVLASAQPQPDPDLEQRIRTIKGLQLRLDKLLPMAGIEMTAHQEEIKPFTRESYKDPGEMASGPEADKWYRQALKLNRIADDLISGGKGDTGRNPWKQFTPEDLGQRVMTTHDFCEKQQKCLSGETGDIESMLRWMRRDVKNGNMTLPDFVDKACQMIDRFEQVVTIEPLPASPFLNMYDLHDRKQVRMLQVRIEKLMQLTFQKRAFLNAAQKQVEDVNALVDAARKKGETPALIKAMDIAALKLLAIADDILAGGDGTTGKKPWKQFTPEDLSVRTKQMGPAISDQNPFLDVDRTFRKMAIQVNAGELSVGDFVDGMCLEIDKLLARQKQAGK